jgi:hypothetical protein
MKKKALLFLGSLTMALGAFTARAGVVVVSSPTVSSPPCTLVEAINLANETTTPNEVAIPGQATAGNPLGIGGCTLEGTGGGGGSVYGESFTVGNLVELQAGTYQVTEANNDWYGPNGLPAISGDVVIVGSPQGSVIEAVPSATSNPFRLFYVGGGESLTGYNPPPGLTNLPGPGTLELVNLTVEGGLAEGGNSDGGGGGLGAGGAIYDQGDVVAEGVTFVGNEALGGESGDTGLGNGANGGGGMGGNADSSGDGGGFAYSTVLWSPVIEMNGKAATITTTFGEFGNGGPANNTGNGGNPGGVGGGGGFGGGTGNSAVGGSGGFGAGGGGGAYFGGFGGFGGGGGNGGSGQGGGLGGGGGQGGAGGGAGLGGAIFVDGGTLAVTNSTFTENVAAGGAAFSGGSGYGGAIFDLDGTVTVEYSTIAGNMAVGGQTNAGGPNGHAAGSGIYEVIDAVPPGPGGSPAANAFNSASVTVDSSILYGNIGNTSNATTDCEFISGSFTGTYDVVGNEGSCSFASNSQTGVDPDLSPLAENGGPTETMAIASSSPAVGLGNPNTNPGVDQRGYARGSSPEVGSYQSGAQAVPVTLSALGNETVTEGKTPLTQGFTVTGAGGVAVTAASSNATLLPDSGIVVTCPSLSASGGVTTENCTIGLTPASAEVGSTAVTLTGVDAYGETAMESFVLTVEAEVPSVTVSPSAVTVAEGTTSASVTVDVTGTDVTLVSEASGDPGLLPQSGIKQSCTATSGGESCTLNLTPAPDTTGEAVVTVTATDKFGQTGTASFTLTVSGAGAASTGGGGSLGILGLLGLGLAALVVGRRRKARGRI